ncbi:MAG: hypothetical protein WC806_01530 [Candidatus Gracilibacteria bacterium]|jgi:hypothetical protein
MDKQSVQRFRFRFIIFIIVAIVLMSGCGENLIVQQKQIGVDNQIKQVKQIKNLSDPFLSPDKKSIVLGDLVLLNIDDDEIFEFFKEKSQLCNESNLTSESDRKKFCEDKETFKSKTNFASIVLSPDKTNIGFSIETQEQTPDNVIGIFYTLSLTNRINFLTNFYLGNKFISFSPSGTNFVYKGGCWEAMCGLFVKDSKTLAEKISLNNPEYADLRTVDAEFVRWISDNEVEYKLGAELKQVKF